MNAPKLNWKANLTCCKCRQKGHLAQECPHTGSSAIAQKEQTPLINSQQSSYAGPTLFPATNLVLLQIIPAETPITAEILQTFREQLTKIAEKGI